MKKNGLMVLFTVSIFLFQCSLPPALLSWDLDTLDAVSRLGGIAWSAGDHYVNNELVHYGNWYGAGYWGGSWDPDKPGDKPPVDSLDEIAMRHDMTYWIAEEFGRTHGPGEEQRIKAIADATAVRETMALDPDPTKWYLPPSDPKKASAKADIMKSVGGVVAKGRAPTGETLIWAKGSGGSQKQLTEQEIRELVDERVNKWNADHPQAGVPISGSAVSKQGQSEGSVPAGEDGQALTNEASISGSEVSVPGGVAGQGQSGVLLGTNGSSETQNGGDKSSPGWVEFEPKRANQETGWIKFKPKRANQETGWVKFKSDRAKVQQGWDKVEDDYDKVYEDWDKVYY